MHRPHPRTLCNLVLLTFVCAGALAMALSPNDTSQPLTHAVRLDLGTLESVTGGVSTDIQWPTQGNWNQSYDNLYFDIDVENGFGTNSATVSAYADNTKVGYKTVSTPGPSHTGSWVSRTEWPFPGKRDLRLKYWYNGNQYTTGDESTLPDQGLNPNVKVHTVRFWNATSPSMSTNVSSVISKGLLDSTASATPNRFTNVDGIYAENCGTWTKTQWRYAGTSVMNISDECMDMVASGRTNVSCRDEFYDYYDSNPANVHVVYIKRNQSNGWAGAHLKSGDSYSITIRDDWAFNSDLDALFAHEVGHTYVGGHTNADCNLTRANRNLMCSNVGRVMNSTQCDTAASSNRYQDRN